MKKNNKKTFSIMVSILVIFFTLLLVFSVWKLVEISMSYAESSKEYEELRQFITVDEGQMEDWLPDEEGKVPNAGDKAQGEGADENASAEMAKDPTQEAEEDIDKTKCPIVVDFEALWETNPDIKAWIYLEEANISYPVVQGETNEEYLYTSVKGTANSGGSIFMDSYNSADFSDPHTIVYGHNMKNGSMFGSLKKLGDQKFIDKIALPVCFWIITPEKACRYDVISVRTVDISGDTYTLFSGQGDVVAEYINTRARTSIVKLDHRTYTEEDKIVTLSTCTGDDRHRLVVHGVLYEE